MAKAPCKDCPDRGTRQVGDKQVDCHSVCQKYIDFKFYMAKMKEAEWKEKMSTPYFYERKRKR